jgi:hypothetical protein
MKTAMFLALFALAGSLAYSQIVAFTLPNYQPIAVDTPHGAFVFDFLKTSSKDGRCVVSARVANTSDTSWDDLKFLINFDAEDNDSHSWHIGVPVYISELGWHQSLWDVTGICPDVLPLLRLKDLRISLISGNSLADFFCKSPQA